MRRLSITTLSTLAILGGCSQPLERPKVHQSAQILKASDEGKITGRQAADVQIAMGRSLEGSNNLEDAEIAYRKALENDPKRADAHARLAVLRDRKGDFEGAAKHFAEAIRRDPKNPEWACDQGYHFYLQRRWAEAEDSLKRAIALDPSHARSHNNLGLVYARRGEPDAALAAFARAGSSPADAQANLGLIMALEGRADDAQKAYSTALVVDPQSPPAREGMRALSVAQTANARSRSIASDVAGKHVDQAVQRTSFELPRLPAR